MAASAITSSKPLQALFLVVVMALVGLSASDLAQDRAECTESLLGLATCLPYVGGDAKAPTPDCCLGLSGVLKKNFKCLCVLVKDRNEPGLGLKINTTLALGLPTSCHSPVNISRCIELLQLDPSSPDAKTFSGFEKTLEQTNSTKLPPSGNGAPSQAEQAAPNVESGSSRKKPFPIAMKVAIGAVIIVRMQLRIFPLVN